MVTLRVVTRGIYFFLRSVLWLARCACTGGRHGGLQRWKRTIHFLPCRARLRSIASPLSLWCRKDHRQPALRGFAHNPLWFGYWWWWSSGSVPSLVSVGRGRNLYRSLAVLFFENGGLGGAAKSSEPICTSSEALGGAAPGVPPRQSCLS